MNSTKKHLMRTGLIFGVGAVTGVVVAANFMGDYFVDVEILGGTGYMAAAYLGLAIGGSVGIVLSLIAILIHRKK